MAKSSASEIHYTAQAEALMAEARAAMTQANMSEAGRLMVAACEAAEKTSNAQLQSDARARAGIIYNHLDKNDLALKCLDHAERIATENSLPAHHHLKLRINRAAFLLGAGFLMRSQKALTEILDIFGADSHEDTAGFLCVVKINLLYNYLLVSRIADAIKLGKEVETVIDQPHRAVDDLARTNFFAYYSMACCQAGDHKKARELLLRIRDAFPPKNRANEIMFSIALGVTEVHANLVDSGLTRLINVLETARSSNLYYQNALHALALVQEHLGNIDEAIKLVNELEKVMRDAARGIVGIEGDEDAFTAPEITVIAQNKAESLAEAIDAQESGHNHPIVDEVDTSSIRRLDDRAARLRMRRFRELTHSERGEVLDQLAKAAALIDDETGKHCARVEKLTFDFAKALGWDDARARLLSLAARMHDIGKLGIPHRILLAPRKLTPMEFEIVKKHVNIGVDLLSFAQHEAVKLSKIIAQHHHERWDGSGYPAKKFQDAIPIEARIVSIADVFDVITHKRAYKRAWNVEFAREELAFHAGKQFDPGLVEVFLRDVVKSDYVIPTDFPNELPTLYE